MPRPSSVTLGLALATTLAATLAATLGCAGHRVHTTVRAEGPPISADDVRAIESVLAADSLEGRGTGTRGSMMAARYIARWFADAGLTPAGDSGFFQRVPMKQIVGRGGRRGAALVASASALDTVPAERRLYGGNVVGVLVGSDPKLRGEVVLVDAHYDHLGVGTPERGDSIYNGADDDASGTTTVMLVARALAQGQRPRRTVVFLATTGEEVGLVGTRWYIDHPVRPLAQTVANLEIEMIGRPDSLVGGAGKAWLTGFDRSSMGQALRDAGVPIVADPRPAECFFERSDNIAFAYRGIPAHTLSTFNGHADYHHATDEADRLDYDHMARVIGSAVNAVRLLADGPRPAWAPNGRPTPPAPGQRSACRGG
ncbi:MAG: M20/M25/M40 family metallo-hydrolase [Gemmatirosa sp.]|nr:M20/M25/M40 family metallo-hydrolase [Gemmatirosa sp.]